MCEEEIIVIEDDIEEEIITIEENIEYISPTTQEKTVIPNQLEQIIIPDAGIFALSQVTVKKIPDEYIIPNGDIEINSNGTYDVTEKSNAIVNVPEKQLGTKTISSNGVYNATDDNLDGYSSVEVRTSGVDINNYYNTNITSSTRFARNIIKDFPVFNVTGASLESLFADYKGDVLPAPEQLDTSKITNFSSFFSATTATEAPLYDTSNATNMYQMFYNTRFKIIPKYNTSNVTNMIGMFESSASIQSVPELDAGEVVMIANMFYGNKGSFTAFGGLKDLGKAYLPTANANYSYYALKLSQCNSLTHDSLMNVINNLYDIASLGVQPQQLILGTTNLAKLTTDEIAIAQNKGWNVS